MAESIKVLIAVPYFAVSIPSGPPSSTSRTSKLVIRLALMIDLTRLIDEFDWASGRASNNWRITSAAA